MCYSSSFSTQVRILTMITNFNFSLFIILVDFMDLFIIFLNYEFDFGLTLSLIQCSTICYFCAKNTSLFWMSAMIILYYSPIHEILLFLIHHQLSLISVGIWMLILFFKCIICVCMVSHFILIPIHKVPTILSKYQPTRYVCWKLCSNEPVR